MPPSAMSWEKIAALVKSDTFDFSKHSLSWLESVHIGLKASKGCGGCIGASRKVATYLNSDQCKNRKRARPRKITPM